MSYQVAVYLPNNAFILVALACFAVIFIVRVIRWIRSIII
jgi:hypothetical protein